MTNPLKPSRVRVLNPRAIHQAPHLSELLRQAGTVPIELPTLSIEGMTSAWVNTLPALNTIAQAIFVSPNAVDFFFKQVNASRWPKSIINLSLGMGTAKKLMHHGIRVHVMPNEANSEHLIHLDTLQHINQQRIALIKGRNGRELIAQHLIERGAQLIELEVYQRTCPKINKKYAQTLWENNRVDMIVITSQEIMHNLFFLFGPHAKQWLCGKPFVVISERLAQSAHALGVKTVITTRYDSLLNTLKNYLNKDRTDE